jgi:hypothetical protein
MYPGKAQYCPSEVECLSAQNCSLHFKVETPKLIQSTSAKVLEHGGKDQDLSHRGVPVPLYRLKFAGAGSEVQPVHKFGEDIGAYVLQEPLQVTTAWNR